MNGHNKYVAAVVAIVGVAGIGVTTTPAAADRSTPTQAVEVTAPASVDAEPLSVDTWESVLPGIAEQPQGPHLIDDVYADLIVRLHGGVCTGTPITGTVYVVTAAHCVLTESGEVTRRTIVRDHVRYPAVAVLVNTDYAARPSAELDAAVLIMAEVIPGPSARLGTSLPVSGEVTLAGYQPVDSDGRLARGHGPHALPKGAAGTQIGIPYRPAGCEASADSLDVSTARVMVPCGLIPGASGGGLYSEKNGEIELVGILSTVTADLTANGIVPLASLHELLNNPERYAHGFGAGNSHREQTRVERS